MLSLRPYQTKAIDAIDAAGREGVRRPLVVHPTGTGKTVTFAHWLAKAEEGERGIILVHREELAAQAAEKIRIVTGGTLRTGIVKAERNEVDACAVIASVPTVSRDNRLADLLESQQRYGPFTRIVADEAHHAPAPSWRKVLTALGSFSPYGPLTAGFTATPIRDGKPLDVWERVVAYMSIREAIYGDGGKETGGYLVPVTGETVHTDMDLRKVGRAGNGDYQEGDLGRELERSGAIEEIAEAYVKHAKDRKGVAFTPTVATAHALAHALCARGIKAEGLDGNTPKPEREAILERLHSGATQVVTNCAVLTEGFDEPSISCVVVARPTKFQGLYIQMVGRGTRLHPGKADLLVLDVTGASERHDLVSLVDLGLAEEGSKKKREGEAEERPCPSCGSPGSECNVPHHRCELCTRFLPRELVQTGQYRHDTCAAGGSRKVDLFGQSRLRWLPVGDGYCLAAGQEVVLMHPLGGDTWKLATYRNARLEILHEELPADWAMGIGEDRAKAFQKLVERDARWLSQRPTDAQLGRLQRDGFPDNKMHLIKTRGDAADLITRIQARHGFRKLNA